MVVLDTLLALDPVVAQYVSRVARDDLLAWVRQDRRDRDFASQKALGVAVEFADAAQPDSGLATRAAAQHSHWG